MEKNPEENRVVLFAQCVCETKSGNLAYTIGRIAFRPGRPMLVEHVGGFYLEHDLTGQVLTPGYGSHYNITHIFDEGEEKTFLLKNSCGF